jgi:hypothetical protein
MTWQSVCSARNSTRKVMFVILMLLVFLPPYGCGEGYYFGPYPEILLLHPLYTEETVIYEPALEGAWKVSGEDRVFEFSPSKDEKMYRLTIKIDPTEEKTIEIPFFAHLVFLGNQRYLDMQLDRDALEFSGRYLELFLSTHWISRVDELGDRLVLVDMDVGEIDENPSFEEFLLEHPGELDFLRIGPLRVEDTPLAGHEDEDMPWAILITAETEDLQRFIMDHHGDEELHLFEDEIVMERVSVP